MITKNDIERYQRNIRAEQEGALLYQELARTEQDPHLADLYRRMSETEQRHATIWAERLHSAGQPVPTYTPTWRIRALIWLAKRFGVSSVLPMISTMERDASREYDTQPEARAAGLPADERSMHASFVRSKHLLKAVLLEPSWPASRGVTAVPAVAMPCGQPCWEPAMVLPPISAW